jgi:hypothetical protein
MAIAALLTLFVLAQTAAQDSGAEVPAPAAEEAPVASGGGETLSLLELEVALLARYGRSERGKSILRHLLESRLVEQLTREQEITIADEVLEARWQELDIALIQSGEKAGLRGYLENTQVTEAVFRRYLLLSLGQEVLARRALGIPAEAKITGEQQRLWMEAVIDERGATTGAWPWEDGVVMRSGDLTLTRADFTEHLREQLSREDLLAVCHQALLLKRVRARMPDLAPQTVEAAVTAEIDRRRKESNSNPENLGVPYESLLGASGLDLEALRQDPAVPLAALAYLWVDRTNEEADLRRVYREERELFDGHYGTAVEARIVLLQCSELTNQFIPRTLDEGFAEASALRDRVLAGEAFSDLARQHSEDRISREAGGKIGWVRRANERVPLEIRQALFDFADRHTPASWKKLTPAERILGPLRVPSGVVLIWVGELRPPDPWTEMARHVHRELRRRFLEECLKKEDVRL